MTASNRTANAEQFVIDRTLGAPIEKVWRMWTTKEGLEKWWGDYTRVEANRKLGYTNGVDFVPHGSS
jgi:uncharacterized protein YndB with AHSA1/START domain